jgi:cytochrome P450
MARFHTGWRVMQTPDVQAFRGIQTWKWYWLYARDPMRCLALANETAGPVCVVGSPLPFADGRQLVLALGEQANRQVLSQPDLFRSGGQVIRGPPGSSHQRMRNGLLAMHGPRHQLHRKIIQPPFAMRAVTGYAPTMARIIDEVLDGWEVGQTRDMFDEMATLANLVAAQILFGHKDREKSIEVSRLVQRWILIDADARRLMLRMDLPGSAYRRLLRHAEVLEQAMRALIAHKRDEEPLADDVLSILIREADRNKRRMNDTELIAHAVILHAASFITTASALAWTLYLIAQNPAIAADLNKEIDDNLGDWPPESRRLDSMPLLDGVLLESLRLLPPVHHTVRTAHVPTDLLGIPMKQGDKVVLSGFITHRNPEVFPRPSRFDPARWTGKKPGPYQYIPFSAGPRMCLGYQFAMLEMKLVVARIMQRFTLRVVPGARIEAACRLTLSPASGIPMTVHDRREPYQSAPVGGNIVELVESETR